MVKSTIIITNVKYAAIEFQNKESLEKTYKSGISVEGAREDGERVHFTLLGEDGEFLLKLHCMDRVVGRIIEATSNSDLIYELGKTHSISKLTFCPVVA